MCELINDPCSEMGSDDHRLGGTDRLADDWCSVQRLANVPWLYRTLADDMRFDDCVIGNARDTIRIKKISRIKANGQARRDSGGDLPLALGVA